MVPRLPLPAHQRQRTGKIIQRRRLYRERIANHDAEVVGLAG